ncbi:hypothetical protein LJR009_000198 [Bosea sp. LjRoot9]|uniref:hypothetical protein n=1 Tax=Bosea sp. LjRoot9 TaxID=3342341 RepID=UPI003ECFC04E
MKRLLSLVLIALMTVAFVFQMRRLLAHAPEGGSPLSWVLAFAVIFGLIALTVTLLRFAGRTRGSSR